MLGHAQPVIDAGTRRGRIGAGGLADQLGRYAGQFLDLLGRMARVHQELGIGQELVPVAALADEGLVIELLGHDHLRHGRQHGDVGAGTQGRCSPSPICGDLSRSISRGSRTISPAPSRSRLRRREAKTGWPSVGLAPMTSARSVSSTESKSCVPAEVPKVVLSRSRWANGRPGRRCRCCCCERPRGRASAPDRFPRWCSATRL